MSRRATLLLLLVCLLTGCGKRAVPAARPTLPGNELPATNRLHAELDAIFGAPATGALWGVQVQSLGTAEVLYARNPQTLLVPASNMKLVTLAVAAERLGWDFRFTTRLEAAGEIQNGTLAGDLVVVGGADPTIGEREGQPRILDDWADALRAKGIARIEGRLIGDDNALDDDAYGDGWAWDDLGYGYSAPAGALQFNENVASLVVTPGPADGAPATVTLEPGGSGLTTWSHVVTGAPESSADVTVWRKPFTRVLEVAGTVPRTGRAFLRTVSVDNPTLFLVESLRQALARKGVVVTGPAVDIDDITAAPASVAGSGATATARSVLLVHESPTLREMGVRFMKASQNMYGETLMATVGLKAGLEPCDRPDDAPPCRGRMVKAARKAYEDTLQSWGVLPGDFIVADGSGLSRYNFLTPQLLVRVLRRMALDPKHAEPFEATLPVAGRDGTLATRFRATKAEGTVRAKTGSLAHVRALSGYLTTAGGDRLVFAIVANNFKLPTAAIDAVADQAVERLVNYGARPVPPAVTSLR
jgi:serine-type D-Ala-D-Ala carboxypeptidase/endopeptidase (penicillin-binding protein 4)